MKGDNGTAVGCFFVCDASARFPRQTYDEPTLPLGTKRNLLRVFDLLDLFRMRIRNPCDYLQYLFQHLHLAQATGNAYTGMQFYAQVP